MVFSCKVIIDKFFYDAIISIPLGVKRVKSKRERKESHVRGGFYRGAEINRMKNIRGQK